MIGQCALPLAAVLAGPLADYFFEPLLAVDGPLADSIGSIIGVGPGRGVAFLFIIVGCFNAAASMVGFLYTPLRCVDTALPDMI